MSWEQGWGRGGEGREVSLGEEAVAISWGGLSDKGIENIGSVVS